jgi:hypothetical protein
VKARTEVPVSLPGQRVTNLRRWDNGRIAGTLDSGTWVDEREYRIIRSRAFRVRAAEYGMAGTCRLIFPEGVAERSYWAGRDSPPGLIPRHQEGLVRYADGSMAIGDRTCQALTVDLPYHCFSFSKPHTYFDLESAVYVKPGQPTPGVATLEVKARHTLIRDDFNLVAKRLKGKLRYGAGTWKIVVGLEEKTVQRVDVHEDWPAEQAGRPDGVVDLREVYTDQALNPPLKLEEFVLEPPDPVKPPAEPKKEQAEPKQERLPAPHSEDR